MCCSYSKGIWVVRCITFDEQLAPDGVDEHSSGHPADLDSD